MAAERQGRTTPVQTTGNDPKDVPESVPRLPHERDESSDSQQSQPRPRIKQAHDDLAQGRTDTDRGPPADAAYERQKESGKP